MDDETARLRPVRDARKGLEAALFEMKRVIVGQETMLERVFVALLAGGHVLLEGVPGLAKTMTIKTVADVLGGTFKRIQFTPDLVPSDLVGTRIYRPDSGALRHRARPGVLQLPARRRDQPRARQGAVGAARGDAGAPGHDRPRHLRGARTRSWCSRRRTRSSPRAPTRCPRRRSTASCSRCVVDYPSLGEEAAVVDRSLGRPPTSRGAARRAARRPTSAPPREVFVDRARGRVRGRARRGDARARRSTGLGDLAPLHRVRRQPARLDQPGSRRARARAAARPRLRAARRTSTTLAHDVLRHRLVLTYEALAEDVDADDHPRPRARRAVPQDAASGVAARRPRRSRGLTALPRSRARPDRPGPGPTPAGGAAGARPSRSAGAIDGLCPASTARLRRAAAPSWPRSGPTSWATTSARSTGT